MKRSIKALLSVAVLITLGSGWGASSAQAQLTSGNAVVTVTLVDVMALAVAIPAVPIAYATTADYQNGKTVLITGQLLVSSNRNYDIKVKSDGDLKGISVAGLNGITLNEVALGSVIPINNLTVQATSTDLGGTTPSVPLSTADQSLVTNGLSAVAKAVNITYTTPANSPYFVRTGAYAATLTYSIVPH